jgi:glycosyltransferase involved in cell wall biosynthesis
MKILYITLENVSLHKGSVVHVKEIVSGLRKLGHRVGLVACSLSKSEKADDFYNLNMTPSFMLRLLMLKRQPHIASLLFLLLYLIKVLPQYDIIYAREFNAVIVAQLPRLIFRKKLIFEINGIANEEWMLKGDSIFNRILSFFIQKGEMLAAQCSDRIVSVTPQIANYLIRQFHCRPDKVEVIGNGVNTKNFHLIQDQAVLAEWRRRLGIADEDVVVAFVGNLALWQGVDILIESAFQLLSKGKKLKFLIIGEGVLKSFLVKKVLDSRYLREFIFTGMIEYKNIPFLINIAEICVAPFISARNRKTGVSPLKVFEYMACGKPVVYSRIEGLEFIEEEGAGCPVEPGDVTSLEKALLELEKEPQKRILMGRKGLQIVHEKFDWESKAKKIEKVLEELV